MGSVKEYTKYFAKEYLPKTLLLVLAAVDLFLGAPMMGYGCEKARNAVDYVMTRGSENVKVGWEIYGKESDDKATGKGIDGIIGGLSAVFLLQDLNENRRRRREKD